MDMSVVGMVTLLILVSLGSLYYDTGAAAPQQAAPKKAPATAAAPTSPGPAIPPAFDGNVANIVWGVRLESITGETKLASARGILFDPFGGSGDYGTPTSPGPVEVVISFFKRDTALIGSVTITTLPQRYGMKDVEIWASSTSVSDGFTKLVEGAVPLEPNAFKGYKGTVSLSATPTPAAPGLQARFEPATVEVAGLEESTLTLALPAGGAAKPFAIEVKGTAADGKTNSLCLQLGPLKAGELGVTSTLAPPSKTGKNLEIILDASGSMKTLMGAKKTRWDVALETLQGVLAQLPDDFKVGLRIYGHREPSTSPKTYSELVVPIAKLDRHWSSSSNAPACRVIGSASRPAPADRLVRCRPRRPTSPASLPCSRPSRGTESPRSSTSAPARPSGSD
jgi:hypothetical protein